jgi:hypothetical protein
MQAWLQVLDGMQQGQLLRLLQTAGIIIMSLLDFLCLLYYSKTY